MTKQEVVNEYIHPKLKQYVLDIWLALDGYSEDIIVIETTLGKLEAVWDLNPTRTFRNINNAILFMVKNQNKVTETDKIKKALRDVNDKIADPRLLSYIKRGL